MTADEIRETNYGEVAYLREIAAQIAELNENIKLMQQLHTVLRETAEKDNFTCEAGPVIDKPKKLKYELCDTVFPSGEKCVRPKNHHEWSKAKCSPTVKFMEYSADTQCEEAHLRVLENKAIRKLLEAGPELEKAKKKYKMHWSKLAGDAYCGGSLRMETTRDKRNVSCLTCRKLMKLHGHLEDV